MKFKFLLAMGLAVASLTSCEDLFEDGSLQPDGSHPYLVIHSPTKKQTLNKAAGLRLRFSVSDKDKVKEVQVRVRESEANTDVVLYTSNPGKSWVDADTLLPAGKLRAGHYTLTVQATDFRTNVSADTVSFTVK